MFSLPFHRTFYLNYFLINHADLSNSLSLSLKFEVNGKKSREIMTYQLKDALEVLELIT